MGHDNPAMSNSTISLSMPQEPRGSYRGSNEFIRKCKSNKSYVSVSVIKCDLVATDDSAIIWIF